MEFLMNNQRKVNGHLSMLLKTFMVGRSHDHYQRIRNLKITWSLSVAPLYILFKDHKGWTLETGKPPPSRSVASAGSGRSDHLSEIISHILEPIVKMRPGGMDFIARVEDVNKQGMELEDIDLELVDEHLNKLEREAQERYDNFDEKMMKSDENLQTGWKEMNESQSYHEEDETIPTGGKPEGKKDPKWMEILTARWTGTDYELVLEKVKKVNNWSGECVNMKVSLLEWITENDETTILEEGEV